MNQAMGESLPDDRKRMLNLLEQILAELQKVNKNLESVMTTGPVSRKRGVHIVA